MTALDAYMRMKVDGYDLALERSRYRFPSVVVDGVTLNRGTSRVEPAPASSGAPRDEHDPPCAGHFMRTAGGTYLDIVLGGGRRLLDDHHPPLQQDSEAAALHPAEDLARLLTGLAGRAFPEGGSYRARFTASGGESVLAALALADRRAAARRRRLGPAVEAELKHQLGPSALSFCIAAGCGGTWREAARAAGRPLRDVPFNGEPGDLEALFDPRPLGEILAAPGGVRAVLEGGRVPPDLVGAVVAEGFQVEGECRPGRSQWLQGIQAACQRHGILFVADEVLTFGRTGTPFCLEPLGVAPDVIALGGCTVQALALARAEVEDAPSTAPRAAGDADVRRGLALLDTYLHYHDPVFEGRTFVENSRIKGEYLRSNLAWLRERHPEWLLDFGGLGCMFGITVKDRDRVVQSAWQHGVKLGSCGANGAPEGPVRLILLADVLTREIDAFTGAMDAVFTDLSGE